MNPSVPQRVLDDAYEKDPISAAAEYGAQFRTDVEALLTREAIEACVSPSVRERPYIPRLNYRAFIDPSGGSADSMTLAIGHREGDGIILDAVRERKPPFSPDDVVSEFAATLKEYKINTVVGDRYAGVWVREPFLKHGIGYDLSEQTKSDLYRDLLPLVNSKVLDLLDHDRLANQLIGLERRTARGGKESIDHAPGSHDDIANSVAGVAALLSRKFSSYDDSLSWVMNRPDGSQPHKTIKEFMEATAPKRAALKQKSEANSNVVRFRQKTLEELHPGFIFQRAGRPLPTTALSESWLRRAFAKHDYVMRKSRRALSLDNSGEFMLVDARTGFSAIGHRYDADTDELTKFLNDLRR